MEQPKGRKKGQTSREIPYFMDLAGSVESRGTHQSIAPPKARGKETGKDQKGDIKGKAGVKEERAGTIRGKGKARRRGWTGEARAKAKDNGARERV